MTLRTRFAPSPTGPLHLGHAYSALLAHDLARRTPDGIFLLRIDDIDRSRARRAWEDRIHDDLTWLGVAWDGAVRRQSDHLAAYRGAIARLTEMGVTYPCRCSRRDIRAAATAPQADAPHGPGGTVYPGTCRGRPMAEAGGNDAIRLDVAKAAARLPYRPTILETGIGAGRHPLRAEHLRRFTGDIVLAAPGMAGSYFLSVVVDDAAQGVSHVVRGEDLAPSREICALLAVLLGHRVPVFRHHALITDDRGKRLAKRDDARAIARYRADGGTPEDIRGMVGL